MATDLESEELLIEQPLYHQSNSTLSESKGNDNVTSNANIEQDTLTETDNEESNDEDDEEEDEALKEQTNNSNLNVPATNNATNGQLEETSNHTTTAATTTTTIPEQAEKQKLGSNASGERNQSQLDSQEGSLSNQTKVFTAESLPANSSNVTTTTTDTPGTDIFESEIKTDVPETMNLSLGDSISESPLPLVSLEKSEVSNVLSANQSAPDQVSSKDAKITEYNDDADAEQMIMVETEQDGAALFLARSGLLSEVFGSGEILNKEKASVEPNVVADVSDVVTTELPATVVNNVNNKESNDDIQTVTESSSYSETTTITPALSLDY